MEKELKDIINKEKLFLTEKEYYQIKNDAEWNNDDAQLCEEIIKLTKLNSKNPNFPNTIAYTNFFRKHRNKCFVKGDLNETVKRFKKIIFEHENEKELFTREMKDIYYIIKLYHKISSDVKKVRIPTRKGSWKYTQFCNTQNLQNGWKNLDLDKRKDINDYLFVYDSNNLRPTDKKIIELLKRINLSEKELMEKICRWTEYMSLWSTAVGTAAEFYIMDQLQEYVKEIKWRWPTDDEDVSNYDVVGEVNNKIIPIQVKLERSAKIGERGIAVSKVFVLYCKELEKYGEYTICPEQFGFKPWAAMFKCIAK